MHVRDAMYQQARVSRSREAIASDVVFGLYPAEPSVARTEPPQHNQMHFNAFFI